MRALALFLLTSISCEAAGPVPPQQISRASHATWLTQIHAPLSPYANYLMSWYEEQLSAPLPRGVDADPEKLFVTVDRPLAQAVKLETDGDVEEGTSYGLETYAVIDAPVEVVLETILFRWGKPVGKEGGVTHPNDIVYGFREERLSPEWGAGSYKTFTSRRNGGIAGDQNDSFSFLLRGNAAEGYAMVGDFIAPSGKTTTTSYITVIVIRPLEGGKTEYRVAGMLTGQSYKFFGLDNGRRSFGFNKTKIRDGQKDFLSQVKSLRETGHIPERN